MKKLIILSSLLLLSACGFHPIYGVNKYTPNGVEEKFEQISISNIPNREGQYLRNALIDRMYRGGRPQNPQYILTIRPVRETQRDLDITIDSDTTRGQLRLETEMILSDATTKKELARQKLNSVASYNVLGSEFANRVSEQYTRENLLNDLARQIEYKTGLYFKENQ